MVIDEVMHYQQKEKESQEAWLLLKETVDKYPDFSKVPADLVSQCLKAIIIILTGQRI